MGDNRGLLVGSTGSERAALGNIKVNDTTKSADYFVEDVDTNNLEEEWRRSTKESMEEAGDDHFRRTEDQIKW